MAKGRPSFQQPGPRPIWRRSDVRAYTAEDMRFTSKGNLVYAFVMAWAGGGKVIIKSLAEGSANYPGKIARVELLGSPAPLAFARDTTGLVVTMPPTNPTATPMR